MVHNGEVSKDRARPFSKKHRRYWIPVLGGMIGIGILNILVGFSTYRTNDSHEAIRLVIPPPNTPADTRPHTGADGTVEQAVSNAEVPGAVMRAFTSAHPRTIPDSAIKRTRAGAISYRLEAGGVSGTYRDDGTPL